MDLVGQEHCAGENKCEWGQDDCGAAAEPWPGAVPAVAVRHMDVRTVPAAECDCKQFMI